MVDKVGIEETVLVVEGTRGGDMIGAIVSNRGGGTAIKLRIEESGFGGGSALGRSICRRIGLPAFWHGGKKLVAVVDDAVHLEH